MGGCGCGNKNKKISGRITLYQALDSNGAVVSEHSSPQEARAAAISAGGRVRVTSRAVEGVS